MFISCRRYFLDRFLNSFSKNFSGLVLDIGGKRNDKRGTFRPADKGVEWLYLNIDESTKPDFLSSAEKIPLESKVADWFLLIEVLEHVENPEKVLKEAYRVLKHQGRGLITMPFLYPVHADPDDYQRWTKNKLECVLIASGFNIVKIKPMGGMFAVILDLLRFRVVGRENLLSRIANRVIRRLSLFVVKKENPSDKITTGWEIVVSK